MSDPIERQDAIEVVKRQRKIAWENWHETRPSAERIIEDLKELASAQPQYEELTPEEAAPEIASGSILRASYWLDVMIALKQMGYAICRKKG